MCSVDSVELDASPQAKVSGVIGGLVLSVAVDFGYFCRELEEGLQDLS